MGAEYQGSFGVGVFAFRPVAVICIGLATGPARNRVHEVFEYLQVDVVRSAALGEEAEVVTPAGRRLRGTVVEANPAYTHGFGPPVPELRAVGEELRALLEREPEA